MERLYHQVNFGDRVTVGHKHALGFSIVKEVALMHGGNLLIIHRPEGGFSSVLVLPRTAAGVPERTDRLPQQSMKNGASCVRS